MKHDLRTFQNSWHKALCKRSNIVGPTSSNIVDNVDLTITLEVYHRIFPNLYFLIVIACEQTIYIHCTLILFTFSNNVGRCWSNNVGSFVQGLIFFVRNSLVLIHCSCNNVITNSNLAHIEPQNKQARARGLQLSSYQFRYFVSSWQNALKLAFIGVAFALKVSKLMFGLVLLRINEMFCTAF